MTDTNVTLALLESRKEKLEKRRSFFKNVGGISVGMVGGTFLSACGGSVKDAIAQAAQPTDIDILNFALNLEYLETEFFCWSALGYGLDAIDANLTGGGPPSIGGQSASLTPFVRDVATQFCYQEVGHLR